MTKATQRDLDLLAPIMERAQKAERQRDRLAEALRGLLAWFEKTDKLLGPCPPEEELPEVNAARAALAEVEKQ